MRKVSKKVCSKVVKVSEEDGVNSPTGMASSEGHFLLLTKRFDVVFLLARRRVVGKSLSRLLD